MLPNAFEGKKACCFTGHRPNGLPDGGDERAPAMIALRHTLLHLVGEAVEGGIETFYAGGAEGFDTLAAEAVLVWRDRYYPSVQLCLALPDPAQAQAYSPDMRMRYERILALANGAYYACQPGCGARAYRMRNRYMVEHADCCIAYLIASAGGTHYTVQYAKKRGIPIYNLAR